MHGSLSHIFPLHKWGTPHFFLFGTPSEYYQHVSFLWKFYCICIQLIHYKDQNAVTQLCNYTNKLHTLLSSASNKSKMWKKNSYIPIFTKLFLTNDNKKKNSIHRWVCKKDYPRYKSSYMCRKINFMFIPSIIVQNCEGRAARARQALIMYHPYLHLYPDLVISISTDSPYIKQMT